MQEQSRELLENNLVETLRIKVKDCLAVYCFGSWGTGSQRADSDIDLAILASSPLDSVERWDLAQQLASLAGRDVDLVDLLKASTVMRLQVVANGERLYCGNAEEVERFENYVFSSYARFNEERRNIIEDIRKRGSVYGK